MSVINVRFWCMTKDISADSVKMIEKISKILNSKTKTRLQLNLVTEINSEMTKQLCPILDISPIFLSEKINLCL